MEEGKEEVIKNCQREKEKIFLKIMNGIFSDVTKGTILRAKTLVETVIVKIKLNALIAKIVMSLKFMALPEKEKYILVAVFWICVL